MDEKSNPSKMTPEIKEVLDDLSKMLTEHETISEYKQLEEATNQHQKLQHLIEEIKRKQKDLVAFDHFEKPEAHRVAQQELDELMKAFNELPIVTAYQESLISANELLQHVVSNIQTEIEENIEKET